MTDLLELSQMIFLSASGEPADLDHGGISVIRAQTAQRYPDRNNMLWDVAKRWHRDPDGSAARMRDCLTVAIGYLDDQQLADTVWRHLFNG